MFVLDGRLIEGFERFQMAKTFKNKIIKDYTREMRGKSNPLSESDADWQKTFVSAGKDPT